MKKVSNKITALASASVHDNVWELLYDSSSEKFQ